MATRRPVAGEQLERKLTELSELVELNEKLVTAADYSVKLSAVWSRDGTGSSEIKEPFQLEIDDTTQNVFVVDNKGDRIQGIQRRRQTPLPDTNTSNSIWISSNGQVHLCVSG